MSQTVFWNLADSSNPSSNELSVVGTSGYPGATVRVFLGGVLQGTTTTDSSGNWIYRSLVLADGGPYSVTSSMLSGPISNAYNINITASIVSFTNTPSGNIQNVYDLWAVQSAAVAYNISNPDTHTLRFEVRSGDRYAGDVTTIDRSEIRHSINYPHGSTTFLVYQFMHETGAANDAGQRLTHLELRNLDTDLPVGIAQNTDKIIDLSILAEKLSLGIRYCPTNLDPNTQATSITPWTSAVNIVRGQWYRVEFYVYINNDSTGICRLWVDGVQVLNYSGPIGFGPYHSFWRAGLVRSTQTNVQSVRIKNLLLFGLSLTAVVTPSAALAGTTRNITVTASGGAGYVPYTYATPVSAGLTFTPVAGQPNQWTFVL